MGDQIDKRFNGQNAKTQRDVAVTKDNTFETRRNRVSGGNKTKTFTTEARRH